MCQSIADRGNISESWTWELVCTSKLAQYQIIEPKDRIGYYWQQAICPKWWSVVCLLGFIQKSLYNEASVVLLGAFWRKWVVLASFLLISFFWMEVKADQQFRQSFLVDYMAQQQIVIFTSGHIRIFSPRHICQKASTIAVAPNHPLMPVLMLCTPVFLGLPGRRSSIHEISFHCLLIHYSSNLLTTLVKRATLQTLRTLLSLVKLWEGRRGIHCRPMVIRMNFELCCCWKLLLTAFRVNSC